MGKLTLIVGLGAGYVLGARAGRGRYEQIRTRANQLWGHPSVQERRSAVGREVRTRAPQVAAAAGSAAIKAAGEAILAPTITTDVTSTTRPARHDQTRHTDTPEL